MALWDEWLQLSKKNDEDCLGVLFSRFEADFVAEKNYNDRNSSNRWEVCWRCAGVFKSLSQTLLQKCVKLQVI